MPATYEPIATTTLGSAASTITFSSIPSTYTDLVIVFAGTATANLNPLMSFNSDSGTNYSRTYLTGNGSGAFSGRLTSQTSMRLTDNNLSTTVSLCRISIFSYTSAVNKTALIEYSSDRNGSGFVERLVGLWRSTASITTVSLSTSTSTFAAGTTATLYGILKA
jgi:hypothetical protein